MLVATVDAENDEPTSSSTSDTAALSLAGSRASRHGWVRVHDGTERVFYHGISTGKITLERPSDFGEGNPKWADGKKGWAWVHYVRLVRGHN